MELNHKDINLYPHATQYNKKKKEVSHPEALLCFKKTNHCNKYGSFASNFF